MRGWDDGTMKKTMMGRWEDGRRGGEEGEYVVLAFPPPPTTPPVVPIDLPYPGQGARLQSRAPPPPRCRLRSRPAQPTNRPADHARGASAWPRLRRSPAARHHSPQPTQPPSPSSSSGQLAPSGPLLLAQIPHGDAGRGGAARVATRIAGVGDKGRLAALPRVAASRRRGPSLDRGLVHARHASEEGGVRGCGAAGRRGSGDTRQLWPGRGVPTHSPFDGRRGDSRRLRHLLSGRRRIRQRIRRHHRRYRRRTAAVVAAAAPSHAPPAVGTHGHCRTRRRRRAQKGGAKGVEKKGTGGGGVLARHRPPPAASPAEQDDAAVGPNRAGRGGASRGSRAGKKWLTAAAEATRAPAARR